MNYSSTYKHRKLDTVIPSSLIPGQNGSSQTSEIHFINIPSNHFFSYIDGIQVENDKTERLFVDHNSIAV